MNVCTLLISFGLLAFGTLPASAWTSDPPRASGGESLAPAISFKGVVSPEQPWRSGAIKLDGADGVSLQVVIGGRSNGCTVFVFDYQEDLAEEIPAQYAAGSGLWTLSTAKDRQSVELWCRSSSELEIGIREIWRDQSLGGADSVSDKGNPQFKNTFDLPSDTLPSSSVRASARLIVGRNSFPLVGLPSRTPDWCSGTLVDDNLLLTASHCLGRAIDACKSTVALFGYDLVDEEELVARKCRKVVYFNPIMDIAIIKLEPSPIAIDPVSLATHALTLDESLAVVQYPRGSIRLVSTCSALLLSSKLKPSRKGLDASMLVGLAFEHNCDTLEGSSGSGVFDHHGSLVGVHQGGLDGRNTAIRIRVLLDCVTISDDDVVLVSGAAEVCKSTV
jgi:hypothetical protein